MKGYELIQKIATGEIKQGAEITEYRNDKINEIYILKETIQEKSTGYEMYNNHLYEEEYTYTVKSIYENKEIEELTNNDTYDFNHLALKINELVRAVNKLIKESEEKVE